MQGHPFASAIKEIYSHLDEQIGRLLSALSPETTIIIMSDHGAGGTGKDIFYLNRFLAQEGFFVPKGFPNWCRQVLPSYFEYPDGG